jgi:hypothetical protein
MDQHQCDAAGLKIAQEFDVIGYFRLVLAGPRERDCLFNSFKLGADLGLDRIVITDVG